MDTSPRKESCGRSTATADFLEPEEAYFQGVDPKWADHRKSVATSSAREEALWPLWGAAQVQAGVVAQVVAEAVAWEGLELPWGLEA